MNEPRTLTFVFTSTHGRRAIAVRFPGGITEVYLRKAGTLSAEDFERLASSNRNSTYELELGVGADPSTTALSSQLSAFSSSSAEVPVSNSFLMNPAPSRLGGWYIEHRFQPELAWNGANWIHHEQGRSIWNIQPCHFPSKDEAQKYIDGFAVSEAAQVDALSLILDPCSLIPVASEAQA
jgi:hypothetical protein